MLPALHIIEPPLRSSRPLPSRGSASSQGNRPSPESLLASHPLPPQSNRGRGGLGPSRGQNLILSPPSWQGCHLNKKLRRAALCDIPAGYTGSCENHSTPYGWCLSTPPAIYHVRQQRPGSPRPALRIRMA